MQSGTHRPQCSEDRPGLGPPGWQLSFLCFSRGLCGLSQGGSWSLSMSMDASRREVNVPGLRTARDRAPKPIESSPPPWTTRLGWMLTPLGTRCAFLHLAQSYARETGYVFLEATMRTVDSTPSTSSAQQHENPTRFLCLVTGGTGLVGRALETVIRSEPVGSRYGKQKADEQWVFLSSKDGDLR